MMAMAVRTIYRDKCGLIKIERNRVSVQYEYSATFFSIFHLRRIFQKNDNMPKLVFVTWLKISCVVLVTDLTIGR